MQPIADAVTDAYALWPPADDVYPRCMTCERDILEGQRLGVVLHRHAHADAYCIQRVQCVACRPDALGHDSPGAEEAIVHGCLDADKSLTRASLSIPDYAPTHDDTTADCFTDLFVTDASQIATDGGDRDGAY